MTGAPRKEHEDGRTDGLFRVYTDVGPDGYPPEWHAQIKHVVRTAAHHRCVRCHHPYRNREHGNGEWSACDEQCDHDGPFGVLVAGRGVVTTVDYSDAPLSSREGAEAVLATIRRLVGDDGEIVAKWRILTVHHLDGNKANCRWWNLAPLCQRCHLTIQGRVVMARIWPWEHSDWFKPYVAGYYAHVYLGEDLTREQVDERLDELLALERAA